MPYRIRAADRAGFKRCRQQWDLGSRNRGNHEPLSPGGVAVDLDRAVRDALAVYYFPGMWEWNRAVVQPLVHRALDRSVRTQADTGATGADAARWFGHELLDAYAAWAPTVDDFTPVRIDTDVEVNIPDPDDEGYDLVTRSGDAIRYTDRVDLLAIDRFDAYWAIQHRLVTDDAWADLDDLLLDERTVAWAWAWPHHYLGMRVAGTVYNEVRLGATVDQPARPLAASDSAGHRRVHAHAAVHTPGERIHVEGTGDFRRTHVIRSDAELTAAGRRLAAEAVEAADPDVHVYPSPSPVVCGDCVYRGPCLLITEGRDPSALLATAYRVRPPEPVEEGRLGGGTWSLGRGAAPPPWARDDP